jgi:hypothetical protein
VDEHTRRVWAWLQTQLGVQNWISGRPKGAAGRDDRTTALRGEADKARTQLLGVDFDAVDWTWLVQTIVGA